MRIFRMTRTLQRLDEMLAKAINGTFTEESYDETELSRLESKWKQYFTMSGMSMERTKAERENIQSMISDISHQMKTPLANIMLYSELLQEQTEGEQEKYLAELVPDSSRRDDPRRSARDDAAEAMHPTMPGATMAANSQRRSSRSMMTINACAAMGATSVIIGRADDPRARRSRLGRHLPRPRRPRLESGFLPSSMPSVWNGVAGMRKLGGTMWSKATELSTFRRVVAGGWNTPTGALLH